MIYDDIWWYMMIYDDICEWAPYPQILDHNREVVSPETLSACDSSIHEISRFSKRSLGLDPVASPLRNNPTASPYRNMGNTSNLQSPPMAILKGTRLDYDYMDLYGTFGVPHLHVPIVHRMPGPESLPCGGNSPSPPSDPKPKASQDMGANQNRQSSVHLSLPVTSFAVAVSGMCCVQVWSLQMNLGAHPQTNWWILWGGGSPFFPAVSIAWFLTPIWDDLSRSQKRVISKFAICGSPLFQTHQNTNPLQVSWRLICHQCEKMDRNRNHPILISFPISSHSLVSCSPFKARAVWCPSSP